MTNNYQICQRCIMDTSDPAITFDNNGYCNHCNFVESTIKHRWYPNDNGAQQFEAIVSKLKQATKGQHYHGIIGLSGGVDSSYLAYMLKTKFGLNPLAVHVDAGWNSDAAVSNIEKLTKKLDIDLHTIVINWEEMKDLQLSYFKSQVANQDVPQDHAFFAGLYNYAMKFNIKHVFSGSNYATESILPSSSWGYNAMDACSLKDIHRRFGTVPLNTYPTVSFFKNYIYYRHIKKMQVIRPLNFMPYDKDEAIKVLEQELGWQYYGGKHHESRFTKFFQTYYLPTKFGFDKRRAHLSSQIMSGQITREAALVEMAKPSFDSKTIASDMAFIAKKLGVSASEFQDIISQPNKSHQDYKSNEFLIKNSLSLIRWLAKVTRWLR